jgi:hypothetical protein
VHHNNYHMFDKYKSVELPAAPAEGSLQSRGRADRRLPADTPLLGVFHGGQARAYPLEALAKAGLVRDPLAGRDCVVLWNGPTRTAAYLAEATLPGKNEAPRAVTLVKDAKVPEAPFVDRETKARWDVAGRAVSGELKGRVLTWLDSTQVKWFAWAAEYPDTLIYMKKNEQ